MAITKGVIAMAGSGTRLGPITTVIPKELMLVGDRPAGQYIVEEYILAGITDNLGIIRSDKKAIMDYFEGRPEITDKLRLHWRFQRPRYGNGVPVLDAASFVGKEPFVFAFADDLIKSERSFTARIVERHEQTRCPVVGCMSVSPADVSRYGILELVPGTSQIRGIIEKPGVGETASTLALFGRMVLTPEIISVLERTPVGKGDELWLTDAISLYIKEGGIVIAEELTDGRWFDIGKPSLHGIAHIEYLLSSRDYHDEIAGFIRRTSETL